MFLYDDQEFMAFVKRVDSEFVYLRCDSRDSLMNRRFWGLSPRNLEQAMAMTLLEDDGVDMTVMTPCPMACTPFSSRKSTTS